MTRQKKQMASERNALNELTGLLKSMNDTGHLTDMDRRACKKVLERNGFEQMAEKLE